MLVLVLVARLSPRQCRNLCNSAAEVEVVEIPPILRRQQTNRAFQQIPVES